MKSLIQRIKKSLCPAKGETLVEAIVSILILAIMMTIIVTMISTSMRLTANSMEEARAIQQGTLNPAFLGDLPAGADVTELKITSLSLFDALPDYVPAQHDVLVFDNDAFETNQNVVAFYPDLNQDLD